MDRIRKRVWCILLAFCLISISFAGCSKKYVHNNYDSHVAGLVGDYQIAVNNDGTVWVVGDPDEAYDFDHWQDVKSVSVGMFNATGIKEDGTVFMTGSRQTNAYEALEWEDIVSLEFMGNMAIGLKGDGTLLTTSLLYNEIGEKYIATKLRTWKDITQIDTSDFIVVGLREDGTVIASTSVFPEYEEAVEDWEGVKYVSVSCDRIIAVTNDGEVLFTVHPMFWDGYIEPYNDLHGAVKVCAGQSFIAGLMPDGTVIVRMTILDDSCIDNFVSSGDEELDEILKPIWEINKQLTPSEMKEAHQYTISNMPDDFKAINDANDIVDINSYEDSLVALKSDGAILVAGSMD